MQFSYTDLKNEIELLCSGEIEEKIEKVALQDIKDFSSFKKRPTGIAEEICQATISSFRELPLLGKEQTFFLYIAITLNKLCFCLEEIKDDSVISKKHLEFYLKTHAESLLEDKIRALISRFTRWESGDIGKIIYREVFFHKALLELLRQWFIEEETKKFQMEVYSRVKEEKDKILSSFKNITISQEKRNIEDLTSYRISCEGWGNSESTQNIGYSYSFLREFVDSSFKNLKGTVFIVDISSVTTPHLIELQRIESILSKDSLRNYAGLFFELYLEDIFKREIALRLQTQKDLKIESKFQILLTHPLETECNFSWSLQRAREKIKGMEDKIWRGDVSGCEAESERILKISKWDYETTYHDLCVYHGLAVIKNFLNIRNHKIPFYNLEEKINYLKSDRAAMALLNEMYSIKADPPPLSPYSLIGCGQVAAMYSSELKSPPTNLSMLDNDEIDKFIEWQLQQKRWNV